MTSSAEKRRQRALKAGPYPRPSGRAPKGSNGRRQTWDKEHGGWRDDVSPEAASAWSASLEFPEVSDALVAAAAKPAAADVAAPAAPAVTWELPTFWRLEESSETQHRRTRLHERVLVTPSGSRAHTFEHTSPGGTTRPEQYVSPAGVRATRLAQRTRCWLRLMEGGAHLVMEARAKRPQLHVYHTDSMAESDSEAEDESL